MQCQLKGQSINSANAYDTKMKEVVSRLTYHPRRDHQRRGHCLERVVGRAISNRVHSAGLCIFYAGIRKQDPSGINLGDIRRVD